ncbi:MAG: MBL fold metallo-hydrolase [Anaerovoracaceae bacterium]
MREVYRNIYLKELSLPNNPLKHLNFYIIKGPEKSMIIDTGFNREDTKADVLSVFEQLNLKPEKTILFLTHLHSDHTGLASYLEGMGLTVYASKMDGDLLNGSVEKDDPMWQNTVQHGNWQGLAEDQLVIEDHPGFKFRPTAHINYTSALPGEFIPVGEYNFEIIDLKGHTPGIVGLYEREHKILFCGDHILGKITPNITFWGFQYGDILGTYLDSLDRVYKMDIDFLFSSHRFLVDDHRKRIKELYDHHNKRLDEAREALKKTAKSTVRTVTKQMHWDINSKSWDDFPKAQKWFAAGEAHAHLEHLRALGEVTMEEENGVLYYTPDPGFIQRL